MSNDYSVVLRNDVPFVVGTPFQTVSPKPDTIRAIKLESDNLRSVAGYIVKQIGGKVEVEEGTSISGIRVGLTFYGVGEWLAEDYDYAGGKPSFRRINLPEREKYDLR